MNKRLERNMILLWWCLSISIIAICNAQEARDFAKPNSNDIDIDGENGDSKQQLKQRESIEALVKQIGEMGLILDNYRRVIVNGITDTNDICGFIEHLSYPADVNEKSEESKLVILFFF
jgi:hypothetical protein